MSIRFRYDGTAATTFNALGREVAPQEEFDVDDELALSFGNHGLCTCLEPGKLTPLRDAETAAQEALAAERAAAGLINAHPAAQTAPARAAAPPAEPTAAATEEPAPAAAPRPSKRASSTTTTDLPSAAE